MLKLSKGGRKYGFKPSMPSRDRPIMQIRRLPANDLPELVDLRPKCPGVYDQLDLGSCTANMVATAIEIILMASKYKWQFTPSRLFNYYNSRSLEGTTDQDSGATVADAVASAAEFGICPETEGDGTKPNWLWPYISNQFAVKPPKQCYNDAVLHKATSAMTVNLDRLTVLNTLAQGKTIGFGLTVHESFESDTTAKTGIMQIPGLTLLDPEIGGHCVLAVGYQLNKIMGTQGVKDWAIVRNSWGSAWGQDGYFYMPLDQILCNPQVSSDAHHIDLVGV